MTESQAPTEDTDDVEGHRVFVADDKVHVADDTDDVEGHRVFVTDDSEDADDVQGHKVC